MNNCATFKPEAGEEELNLASPSSSFTSHPVGLLLLVRDLISLRTTLVRWAEEKNIARQRHNGPWILSPKLELSLKAETNANSNNPI